VSEVRTASLSASSPQLSSESVVFFYASSVYHVYGGPGTIACLSWSDIAALNVFWERLTYLAYAFALAVTLNGA